MRAHCCGRGQRALGSESGALEAGPAAPRFATRSERLSLSCWGQRTPATARAKARVSPPSLIAPSPVLPTATCSVPRVGAKALSSPKSGGGLEMTRKQIILTTGSGHRQGHRNCRLGRLPGGEGSRACLGRSKKPDYACITPGSFCPTAYPRVHS